MSHSFELCVASVEAARLANNLPLARIETCNALEQGGLTPSIGFVTWIRDTFGLEQHILIRQRPGGFRYSYDEIVVMRDDVLRFKELGVKGVVVGALNANGDIDKDAIEVFHRSAGSLDLTFHRAFDEVRDWRSAMDELIKLRFKRILTSGQASNVDDGLETLKEMVAYANGRIEIMAGGGVNPNNVSQLIAAGIPAIHFSGTESVQIDSESRFSTWINKANEEILSNICK